MVSSNFFVTAAIGAKAFAEREMNIKGDTVLGILNTELPAEIVFPFFNRNFRLPLWNGRITGVPGNRSVVFLQ